MWGKDANALDTAHDGRLAIVDLAVAAWRGRQTTPLE